MAEFLNMDVESKALKCILNNLIQDQDWDLDDPVEKGMHDADEIRYNMNTLKKGYHDVKNTKFHTDCVVRSKDKEMKGSVPLEDGSAEIPIKIEFPWHIEYMKKLAVMKNVKGVWS